MDQQAEANSYWQVLESALRSVLVQARHSVLLQAPEQVLLPVLGQQLEPVPLQAPVSADSLEQQGRLYILSH
jgi:hypothetical protein